MSTRYGVHTASRIIPRLIMASCSSANGSAARSASIRQTFAKTTGNLRKTLGEIGAPQRTKTAERFLRCLELS